MSKWLYDTFPLFVSLSESEVEQTHLLMIGSFALGVLLLGLVRAGSSDGHWCSWEENLSIAGFLLLILGIITGLVGYPMVESISLRLFGALIIFFSIRTIYGAAKVFLAKTQILPRRMSSGKSTSSKSDISSTSL
ncbi:MAG: hypothetical protein UZ21_OP11001000904 [Microgenomates bacterium OLB22]|nr:MAG: hypothetical protein UZ21_OP11001000904 [Microgenomates bacterium OLB22]